MSRLQRLSSFLQSVPSFRGKRRIGRFMVRLSGASGKKKLMVKTKAGRFLLPNLKEIISLELFICGFYERGLVDFLVKNIPQQGIFIDMGANIGSVCIPLAHRRPDIKVIAIEASPWIYKFLKENVALNDVQNITPVNFAGYSESGKSLQIYAPAELFGKGSLKAVYTKDGENVETITIDDIKERFNLPAIHFIKVDVEGFEAAVFQGMATTALVDKPKIVFEFSEWAETAAGYEARQAQEIILSKGYKLQLMDEDFRLIDQLSSETYKGKNANLFALKND